MININRTKGLPDAKGHSGGAGIQAPSDFIVEFTVAVGSSINQRSGSVEYNITGIEGVDVVQGTVPSNTDPYDNIETTDDAEHFSAPGIMGRPLPPESVGGVGLHMEVLAVRTMDGLVPISYRDTRIKMGTTNDAPGQGVFAFCGYGGGFWSHTPIPKVIPPVPPATQATTLLAGNGTLATFYCPYDTDDAGLNPQKAHVVTLDPTPGNESVMLVHGDGMAVTMSSQDKKAILLKNAAGDATFRLDDDGITMTAKQITLNGVVIVGTASSALPLLPGSASQGSNNLRIGG